jgi:hypothetical protein
MDGAGTACLQDAPCALQTALAQATGGDTIYVAQGTYTGTGAAVVTITQSITLCGGWDGTTTTPVVRASQTYPTTLDGEGQRRVVYIPEQSFAYITPTLEGLRLTNGSASGPFVTGSGGGICAQRANLLISGCQIYGNTAEHSGGGVYLDLGDGVRLVGNQIYSNTAMYGGGAYLTNLENVTLAGNEFSNNAAGQIGGGLAFADNLGTILVNNIVVENQIGSGDGAGVYASGPSKYRLLHTTIARNSGGGGQGIYAERRVTLWVTNTILVSHTVGVETAFLGTAVLTGTLWGDGVWANITDTVGSDIFTSTADVRGDPVFVDPGNGDYHIGAGSAAINAGVEADVTADIDGEPRPWPPGGGYDIGADEFFFHAYLPLILSEAEGLVLRNAP